MQGSRTFCDLDLSTDLGLQVVVATLWRGGAVFFPGTTPENTWHTLECNQVQNLITTPAGLRRLLDSSDREQPLNSPLSAVAVVGSGLPNGLAERARALLSTNLITAYGTAETGMVAAMPHRPGVTVAGTVGFVTPAATIEIVDASDRLLPLDTEGVLRICGGCNIAEYGGASEGSKGRPLRNGWFYPGDLGVMNHAGMLTITKAGEPPGTARWAMAEVDLEGARKWPEKVDRAGAKSARMKAPW
jgi:acyl-coenzyme A synthetase/AMP-(fatty) acid ligase